MLMLGMTAQTYVIALHQLLCAVTSFGMAALTGQLHPLLQQYAALTVWLFVCEVCTNPCLQS